MRLAWLTDIHLNFVEPAGFDRLLVEIRQADPEGVLISGDIAEADTLIEELGRLVAALTCPIHFVLGNHDFYRGWIAPVRLEAAQLARENRRLTYLTAAGVMPLSDRTALVGHDGWGDGGYGDAVGTQVLLNDFWLIGDFRGLDRDARLDRLRSLGQEAARHLDRVLPEALLSFEQVIVLTHVPPFRESCWHEGRHSSEDYLPFFACRATGAALLAAAERFPDRRLLVLCGHTHGRGEVQVRPNLTVWTGGAEYGRPAVERLLDAP